MATPDHMAGINAAVPRWDRSNPTTYSYDPKNYNAADYEQFRQARQAADQKRQAAAVKRSKQTEKDNAKFLKDFLKGEKSKAQQSNNEGIDRDQVMALAKAGHTLYADIPSSAFESFAFVPDKDDPTTGTLVGTFNHGGSLTYEGEADLEDFLDAVASGSLGGWYNDNKPF